MIYGVPFDRFPTVMMVMIIVVNDVFSVYTWSLLTSGNIAPVDSRSDGLLESVLRDNGNTGPLEGLKTISSETNCKTNI